MIEEAFPSLGFPTLRTRVATDSRSRNGFRAEGGGFVTPTVLELEKLSNRSAHRIG